jgi:NAD(P)-dependent dehydrogenase (short-subunit alcohol dehydrogenase family)
MKSCAIAGRGHGIRCNTIMPGEWARQRDNQSCGATVSRLSRTKGRKGGREGERERGRDEWA